MKFISALVIAASLILQCKGYKPVFPMQSLFLAGNYQSRASHGDRSRSSSQLPMTVTWFDPDAYARSMERAGMVQTASKEQRLAAGFLRNSEEANFKRWATMLEKKTALTPSIYNMLKAFVHDNMPYHVAALLSKKLSFIDLDATKPSQLPMIWSLFKKVMSRPPLSLDQLFRHLRGFATTGMSLAANPVASQQFLVYLETFLCEVNQHTLPNIIRYLGIVRLTFKSLSESLGTALLNQLVRFSDTFTAAESCVALDGLGQMKFNYLKADSYVQEAVMVVMNRAIGELDLSDPYLNINLRAMFLGARSCGITYDQLSDTVKQTIITFIDEKVPLMSLDNQANVFRSLGILHFPWSALSDSNRSLLEEILLKSLTAIGPLERDTLLRAVVGLGLTVDQLKPEVQEEMRQQIYNIHRRIVSSVFEVMGPLNIQWSSVPSEVQATLLDNLVGTVKFMSMSKVVGVLNGLETLGLTKEQLPVELWVPLQAVLHMNAKTVRRIVKDSDQWTPLVRYGLTLDPPVTATTTDAATDDVAADDADDTLADHLVTIDGSTVDDGPYESDQGWVDAEESDAYLDGEGSVNNNPQGYDDVEE